MNVKILDSISSTFKNISILDIIIMYYMLLVYPYEIPQVTNLQLQMRLCLSQWRKQYPS